MIRSVAITRPLELIATFFFGNDFDCTMALGTNVLAPEIIAHIQRGGLFLGMCLTVNYVSKENVVIDCIAGVR
jgi:hypothetical protein